MSHSNSDLLCKQDIPLVSLDIMNQTHQEEIDIINNIYALLQQEDSSTEQITDLLDQWLEHTQEHFERENRFMQQYHFPAFPIHSNEHQQTLEIMSQHLDHWKHNHDNEALKHYMAVDWLNWFKAHVASMDMVTAQFLDQVMPENEK